MLTRSIRLAAVTLPLCLLFIATSAQAQTPGGSVITNSASATFTDSDGQIFSAVSNTVSTTVANVAGLTITPDAGTRATVVSGQGGVNFVFRLTNTGNFANQIRFLASGASITITGPGTVTAGAIDVNGNGAIDGGDTDIFGNGADVLSASLAMGAHIDVVVLASVNANATAPSVINVRLGDAATGSPSFDSQTADTSAHEVRTVSSSAVNGILEGRGDISASVENDAGLLLTLTAPPGPLALGADINYDWQVCNNGARAASAITLVNAPPGSNSGVFIIAPIPVGTILKSGQSFPAGTLYSTSPFVVAPLLAVWTSAPPSNLADVKRVAFNVGNSLASGACSSTVSLQVTINTSNASTPIVEIGDVFATNQVGLPVTDQSGDNVPNAGDWNASFDEGNAPGSVDGNGIPTVTLLSAVGAVLLGPLGNPNAVGPTNNNDDYTNRSVVTGITNIPPGGVTDANGVLLFSNTIQNSGNANDTIVLTAVTVPSGFTVEISTNGGFNYTTIQQGSGSVNVPLNFGDSTNIIVRVTAPAGQTVLTGYDIVLRATSTNTPGSTNDTIDRLYTGFLRFDKTVAVTNSTGVGGANDAVPGAELEYTITYTNIATTGGTGNRTLTATTIVITENGNVAPNTWGSTTTHIVGATDSRSGVIIGDILNSSLLVDTVPSVGPGQSGQFKFRRRVN